jgi:hypothetical protein
MMNVTRRQKWPRRIVRIDAPRGDAWHAIPIRA